MKLLAQIIYETIKSIIIKAAGWITTTTMSFYTIRLATPTTVLLGSKQFISRISPFRIKNERRFVVGQWRDKDRLSASRLSLAVVVST